MTRRRRWLIFLVVLLALGIGGSLLVRHLTRPELLARLLVQQIEQRTGLVLRVGAEPDISLLPRLSLELRDVALALPSGEVLVSADMLQLALPWRALREPVISLDSLSLRGASIDLDALWLLGMDDSGTGPPPPLRLPPVATQLRLSDSRIHSTARGFSLEGVHLDSAPLIEGSPWRLNVRGRLHSGDDVGARTFLVDLATVPRHTAGGLRLADLSASVEQNGEITMQAQLRGVIELTLPQTSGEVILKLSRWPRELPDLPFDGDLAAPVELALRWSAIGLGPGSANFRMSREDLSLDGEADFGDLLGWLVAGSIDVGPGALGGLPPSPPLRGVLRMPQLTLDDIRLEGIEVIMRDPAVDPPPP